MYSVVCDYRSITLYCSVGSKRCVSIFRLCCNDCWEPTTTKARLFGDEKSRLHFYHSKVLEWYVYVHRSQHAVSF
ncbi:hypothetical protein M378DRAFT_794335 [Amanita muscaria Koide BX008]|uniref:Uncharacterized protein n=1 Tax=Amanita muscaria (strain Koide BX008) TaxID=946122 RepID=A0A0C2X163_AMAMK|nr:hypothetical protein M378DRAFT_794335 [Amanita muscaria Koide BX008]